MEFNRMMDSLPFLVKILVAAIPPLAILWVVYQLVRDAMANKIGLVVVDVIFDFPLGFLGYIFNLVSVASHGTAWDYSRWSDNFSSVQNH